MARYTIDFSTNANAVVREIEKVNSAIAKVAREGKSVSLKLDTSGLKSQLNGTFAQLNREIAQMQSKLSRLRIGGQPFRKTASSIGFREGQVERGQMIAQPLRLRGQAQSFEEGSLTRLQKELQALQIEAAQIKPATEPWAKLQGEIGRISEQLRRTDNLAENIKLTNNLGALSPGSLNQLETKLTILRNRAREIAPNTKEWKDLNKEIVKAERNIEKQTAKPLTRGQRLGAAGGAFLYGGGLGGGAGSALGGIAGGLMGGVPGAFTGAAIGQVVDNLGAMVSSVTKGAASIAQLQRGLALASIDASDFSEAQRAIKESSDRLVVPMEQVYRQFTQLRVNTKQYGLSVQDTQEILEGTVLAVSSVGGSLDDVDGAMRAVVQIFSKGSVQAEELRGQLGERFPGAVVKFAEANKLSFEELQDGLQQGKIGIQEFVTFAKENYEDYGKFAERLATGPEFAGRRLEKAMSDMQIAIGSALGPAGAIFQDFFTETIKGFTDWVNNNKQFVSEYLRDWAVFVTNFGRVLGGIVKIVVKVSAAIIDGFRKAFREVRRLLGMISVAEVSRDLEEVNAKIKAAGGEQALKSSGRGARMNPLLLRRSQLQQQFKDAGGQAALDAQQPQPVDNFDFGGPGAGLGLAASGDGGTKGRAKKERESQVPQLKLQLELSKQLFEIDKQIAAAKTANNLTLSSELELVRRLTELQYEGKKILLEKIPADEQRLKLEELQFQRQQEILNNQLKFQLDLNAQYVETKKKLEDIVASQREETAYVEQYHQLVMNGVNPSIARTRIEIAKRFAEEKKSLDLQIEQTQTSIDQQKATIELLSLKEGLTDTEKLRLDYARERLAILERELKLREGEKGGIAGKQQVTEESALAAQSPKSFGVIIAEGREDAEKEFQQVANSANMVITAANGIGDAFGKTFTDIVTGAQTWRDGLAGMFESVASMFADMVAQMLAKWAALQILNMFNPGGAGAKPPLPGSVGLTAANGAVWQGGFTPFANGGVVNGPTLGLVGEGRFNEAIVPLPNGKSIPVELGQGAGNNISTNIVVNMNNGQASSQASGRGGQALGRELEGAVRNVILKESRPGGLIYSGR